MGVLFYYIAKSIPDSDNDKSIKLQCFFQNYIKHFAFNNKENISSSFINKLIEIMTDSIKMKDFKENYEFEWNDFTKIEVIKQILNLKKNQIEIMETFVQNEKDIQSKFSCLILNSFEQIIYKEYINQNIDILSNEPPKQQLFEEVAQKFNNALNESKLYQLQSIAHCKFMLQQFCQSLKNIFLSKSGKYKISENGIIQNKGNKIIYSVKYLQIIGQIITIPLNNRNYSKDIKNIKRGLNFFIVSQIWNLFGQQKAIKILKMPLFTKIMGLNQDLFQSQQSIIYDDDNIPNDNIFNLHQNDNNTNDNNKSDFELKANNFKRKDFIHLIGYLFQNYFF